MSASFNNGPLTGSVSSSNLPLIQEAGGGRYSVNGSPALSPKKSHSPLKPMSPTQCILQGWLFKWTNYLKGYQKRWFVLENCYLSYYRSPPPDTARNSAASNRSSSGSRPNSAGSAAKIEKRMKRRYRGAIKLIDARVMRKNSTAFVITAGVHTFHLKASSDAEREKWVAALNLAKHRAIHINDVEEEESLAMLQSPHGGLPVSADEASHLVQSLNAKLSEIKACSDLITKHGAALQKSLEEAEAANDATVTAVSFPTTVASSSTKSSKPSHQSPSLASSSGDKSTTAKNRKSTLLTNQSLVTSSSGASSVASSSTSVKLKSVTERTNLFKLTTNALLKASSELIELSGGDGNKLYRLVKVQHDRIDELERTVRHMAKESSKFEQRAYKMSVSNSRKTSSAAAADGSLRSLKSEGALPTFFPPIPRQLDPAITSAAGRVRNNNKVKSSSPLQDGVSTPTPRHPGPVFSAGSPASAATASPNGGQELNHTLTQSPSEEFSEDDEEMFQDALSDFVPDEYVIELPKEHNKHHHKRNASDLSCISDLSRDGDPGEADDYDSSDSDEESDGEGHEVIHVKGQRPKNLNREASRKAKYSRLLAGNDSNSNRSADSPSKRAGGRVRRKSIPPKPNYSLNLWSFMKNAIGKDLTKISMPVNFNEPLSFLQRLTEEFEYAECLDIAASCTDTAEQLVYIAAFTISSYATTSFRVSKPFNPLLGETYECDRSDDLGWKSLAEQVSHHPPTAAMYTEGVAGWTHWQEYTMSSKFRGKYVQIIPLGIAHLRLHNPTGSIKTFSWRKVNTTVHNIIIGTLWVDNHGEMEIRNHESGDICTLKFSAYSFFSSANYHKVTGVVKDKDGNPKWVLNGTWDEAMSAAPVLSVETDNRKKNSTYRTGTSREIWRARPIPAEHTKIYNFTTLAMEMNEPEEGVAPTDARLRPDLRLMEETKWDEASNEKIRLEEKQRAVRREREAELERCTKEGREYVPYKPCWFRLEADPLSSTPIHQFTREYWTCKEKADWSRCPDIF